MESHDLLAYLYDELAKNIPAKEELTKQLLDQSKTAEKEVKNRTRRLREAEEKLGNAEITLEKINHEKASYTKKDQQEAKYDKALKKANQERIEHQKAVDLISKLQVDNKEIDLAKATRSKESYQTSVEDRFRHVFDLLDEKAKKQQEEIIKTQREVKRESKIIVRGSEIAVKGGNLNEYEAVKSKLNEISQEKKKIELPKTIEIIHPEGGKLFLKNNNNDYLKLNQEIISDPISLKLSLLSGLNGHKGPIEEAKIWINELKAADMSSIKHPQIKDIAEQLNNGRPEKAIKDITKLISQHRQDSSKIGFWEKRSFVKEQLADIERARQPQLAGVASSSASLKGSKSFIAGLPIYLLKKLGLHVRGRKYRGVTRLGAIRFRKGTLFSNALESRYVFGNTGINFDLSVPRYNNIGYGIEVDTKVKMRFAGTSRSPIYKANKEPIPSADVTRIFKFTKKPSGKSPWLHLPMTTVDYEVIYDRDKGVNNIASSAISEKVEKGDGHLLAKKAPSLVEHKIPELIEPGTAAVREELEKQATNVRIEEDGHEVYELDTVPEGFVELIREAEREVGIYELENGKVVVIIGNYAGIGHQDSIEHNIKSGTHNHPNHNNRTIPLSSTLDVIFPLNIHNAKVGKYKVVTKEGTVEYDTIEEKIIPNEEFYGPLGNVGLLDEIARIVEHNGGTAKEFWSEKTNIDQYMDDITEIRNAALKKLKERGIEFKFTPTAAKIVKKGDRHPLETSSPAELADSSKLIAHSPQLIEYKMPSLPGKFNPKYFDLSLFRGGETVDYDRLGILRKVLGVFAEGPLSSKAANFNAKPGELSLFGAVPTQ
ncbi:hypothetical protein KJ849_01110, partial [bacterium]|nr:hypothetical protein [bacterium]